MNGTVSLNMCKFRSDLFLGSGINLTENNLIVWITGLCYFTSTANVNRTKSMASNFVI